MVSSILFLPTSPTTYFHRTSILTLSFYCRSRAFLTCVNLTFIWIFIFTHVKLIGEPFYCKHMKTVIFPRSCMIIFYEWNLFRPLLPELQTTNITLKDPIRLNEDGVPITSTGETFFVDSSTVLPDFFLESTLYPVCGEKRDWQYLKLLN